MTSPLIDIHTHNKLIDSVLGIESFSIDKVSFYQKWPKSYSVGIHPWYIHEINVDQAIKQLTYIASDANLKAIGECGLDRAIARNFDNQYHAFMEQLKIAEKYDKPLIVHNVRAYSDFLGILKKEKPAVPFIFHGFNANQDILKKLIKHNVYFSVGAEIMKDNSKAQRILLHIPINRLFFETDEWIGNIEELYLFASKLRGIDINKLRDQIYYNYKSVFV